MTETDSPETETADIPGEIVGWLAGHPFPVEAHIPNTRGVAWVQRGIGLGIMHRDEALELVNEKNRFLGAELLAVCRLIPAHEMSAVDAIITHLRTFDAEGWRDVLDELEDFLDGAEPALFVTLRRLLRDKERDTTDNRIGQRLIEAIREINPNAVPTLETWVRYSELGRIARQTVINVYAGKIDTETTPIAALNVADILTEPEADAHA